MGARRLDGLALARQIREEIKPRAEAFKQAHGRAAGLGIVLAGNDPGSEVYVRNKVKAAAEAGVHAELTRLPESAALSDVLAVVGRLNRSDECDGILVQSPLPAGMGADAEPTVFDAIDPAKDVDGFTPANVGRLVQKRQTLVPCTPLGVIALLERNGIAIAGARAVVVGRSDIVGKPMAMLLMHRDATVTVCHSKTRDLPAVCAAADILVAAIGRAAFVTKAFVKPDATVIDVGINRVSDGVKVREWFADDPDRILEFERKGSILVGDVHPAVAEVAGALTPVPGGVGPLTIALLLSNTLAAAEARAASPRGRR